MKYNGFETEELASQREERQKELNNLNLNKSRRKYLTKLIKNQDDPDYNSNNDFLTYLYEQREHLSEPF